MKAPTCLLYLLAIVRSILIVRVNKQADGGGFGHEVAE
jgi:hypothetical protein